jgi:hypothetical protein
MLKSGAKDSVHPRNCLRDSGTILEYTALLKNAKKLQTEPGALSGFLLSWAIARN